MNNTYEQMAENSTSALGTGSDESFAEMDLDSFAKTFASKHLIGTLLVFCGTILMIAGGAAYCWCRYFRRDSNDDMGNANNGMVYDGANRRDTVVLNLRRQSRRDTLVLPFILH